MLMESKVHYLPPRHNLLLEVLNFSVSFSSSQVLFLICCKLTSQQMVNGTEVLKWLREILICRNKFLLKNKVEFH